MAENIMRLSQFVQQGFDQGRERQKQSKLAQLASQAYGADPNAQRGFVQEAIGVDPTAGFALGGNLQKGQQGDFDQLSQAAAVFSTVPPEQKAQFYAQSLAPLAQRIGFPVPGQYNPQFDQMIEKLASAGQKGDGVPADIRTLQMLRDNPGLAALDTKRRQAPKYMWTDRGLVAVSPDGATPIEYGGSGTQFTPNTSYQTPSGIARIGDVAPEDMAAVEADMRSGGAQDNYNLPPQDVSGGIVQPAPKQPSPIEQARFRLEAERLRLAQESAGVPAGYRRTAGGALEAIPGGPADPSSPKPMSAAVRAKLDQRMRKEKMLLSANNAGIDQTVKLIDSILARKSDFVGVTGIGRVGSMIPGTDWANVAAKLDTLKARSAFGALQQMRANSPTGGALGQVTERELYMLQNAETQLQNSQSPEALAQALADYKAVLLESKKRMAEGVDEFYSQQGAQSAAPESGGVDDLLSKYGVK